MRLFDPEEWRRVSDAEERSESEADAARATFLEVPTESNRERYAAAVRVSVEAHDRVLASIRETSWDGRPEIRRYGQGAFDGTQLQSDTELVARLQGGELPSAIVDHLVRCTQTKAYSRCLEAMRSQPDEVTAGVQQLISEAARITGLSRDDLISRTDFNPADLNHDRLDAALAELRAIVWLRDEGFSNIRLVRGSQRKRERRTDLLANREGAIYAFDVACSSAGAERRVQDLRAFLCNRYVEKLSQLEATRQEHACAGAGLILVLNSDPALTFGYQPRFREVLQEVHGDLGSPQGLHLAIVTGRTTTIDGAGEHFSGPDDVVWPAWPVRP